MGTFLDTLSVRTSDAMGVRSALVRRTVTEHMHVVQAPRAFYCFTLSHPGPVPSEVEALFRAVVKGFVLL